MQPYKNKYVSYTNLVNSITNINNPDYFSNYFGRINYSFSRIIGQLIGTPSDKKIAMATGVLQEDSKIVENVDIVEYKYLRR